jgi:hypothetical protein
MNEVNNMSPKEKRSHKESLKAAKGLQKVSRCPLQHRVDVLIKPSGPDSLNGGAVDTFSVTFEDLKPGDIRKIAQFIHDNKIESHTF